MTSSRFAEAILFLDVVTTIGSWFAPVPSLSLVLAVTLVLALGQAVTMVLTLSLAFAGALD